MRSALIIMVLALAVVTAGAQTMTKSWQEVYDDVMTIDDDDDAAATLAEGYELLEQLAQEPLDLNRATRQELEQLPFLSEQQVMDIQEYLYRYGPMRSLGELRMVRSLDYQQLALLPFFVCVSGQPDAPPDDTFPRLDTLLRHARHTLSATVRIPFYERAGDDGHYLGYPYRHTLRYDLSSHQRLRLGFVAAQDAGEPFFGRGNGWGYDYYSCYLQVRRAGRLDNLLVGRYRVEAGMGLVLGQSFSLGKLAALQNAARSATSLRPHSSRSEADFFQGAAATVRLLRPVQLTAFASWRPVDATLNSEGDAQTLITDGYHRTTAEMQKKGNTHLSTAGLHISFIDGPLRLGATAVSTRLDRSLEPQRQVRYRRHYAHGRHFFNASLDYAYTHPRLALKGETALDADGHLATINSLSLRPASQLSMLAVQRFYSYRYTTLFGHSFGEGSRVQNESGLYVGATWHPVAHVQLQAYADYAYFPWARYQVSRSSHAWDMLVQATYQRGHWALQARHRSRLRQRDDADKNALTRNDDHRQRLALTYTATQWSTKTQLDMASTYYLRAARGWMLSQHASLSLRSHQLGLVAAYFHTDNYQSRIYLYERPLQYDFYFPSYYGEGLRLLAQARLHLGSHVQASARLGYTNYFDRPTIGSGLQQISHSHQTDLDLQLRWRF